MAYRVDNSTSTGTKPTRAAVGVNPNSYYQDATVLGADMMNMVIDEVCNVVEGASITLDKEAGAAPPNDNQLLAAIKALQKTVANPFYNYALFRQEFTSGTDGGALTASTWVKRVLNTSSVNRIAGCSLSSSQVTLAAGTYRIRGLGVGFATDDHTLALYNVTDAAFSIIGIAAESLNTDDIATSSEVIGEITIAGAKTFELQHWSSHTQANGQGSANTTGQTEVYASIEIWKLD